MGHYGTMGWTNAINWYRIERPSTTVDFSLNRTIETQTWDRYIHQVETYMVKLPCVCFTRPFLLQLMSWLQVDSPTNPRLATGLEHHFRTINLVFWSSLKLSRPKTLWYSIIIKHVGLIYCPDLSGVNHPDRDIPHSSRQSSAILAYDRLFAPIHISQQDEKVRPLSRNNPTKRTTTWINKSWSCVFSTGKRGP